MNELKRLNWKVNALMVFAPISFIANIIFAVTALSLINTMAEYSQCWSYMYMK